MAIDRDDSASCGGGRYGEILLYERELTEREKVATRNYLQRKWFGKTDSQLADLPDAVPARITGSISYPDGGVWNIVVGADGKAEVLSVTGTLAFGNGMTVNFSGLPKGVDVRGLRITVAIAGSFENIEALNRAALTGYEFDDRNRPEFVVRGDGRLVARFGKFGSVVILR